MNDIDANTPAGGGGFDDTSPPPAPIRESVTDEGDRDPGAASTVPLGGRVAERRRRIWHAGDRVDRYELIEQIGAGGMGVVWSARDVDLGREVAVKLSYPEQHARLLAEAQAMARIAHPNVVAVHDIGPTDDGLFIAMERVDGGTLGEWLRAVPRAWDEIAEKFVAAGRGLAAVHSGGLIHRDFKPENVLIGRDGVARLSDFGLALSHVDAAQADSAAAAPGVRGLTEERAVPVGTLAYMSPEQLLGQSVTVWSDQFSFCLALHEAVYRVSAFGTPFGQAPAVFFLAAVAEGRVAPPPPHARVPDRLRRLIIRGLRYQPEERWPTVDVLVAELERCLTRIRGRRGETH